MYILVSVKLLDFKYSWVYEYMHYMCVFNGTKYYLFYGTNYERLGQTNPYTNAHSPLCFSSGLYSFYHYITHFCMESNY